MTSHSDTDETGRLIVVVVLGAILAAVAVPILLFMGVMSFMLGPYRTVVADPSREFTQFTGLEWPSAASIVSVADDHGGFIGDGEFHIVFDADRETLERWLAESPPWDQTEWKPGPVPGEIGFHCTFGLGGIGTGTTHGGQSLYFGNPELVQLLSSRQIRYAADSHCGDSCWHNGALLVIDPTNSRVWLSQWDF